MSEASREKDYEFFLKLAKKRRSCRRFKSDPIPDGYIEKILDVARWAMSGANSQPWEFIVVKDKAIRENIYETYVNYYLDYIFWLEQQRTFELRHPDCQIEGQSEGEITAEEALRIKQNVPIFRDAPVIIAVCGDGRKQWGAVIASHTTSFNQTHLTDGTANASQLIHLATASLGLNSQWVSLHVQGPMKRVLNIPDVINLHSIIPIGYAAGKVKGGYRERLSNLIHYDQYDHSRLLNNKEIIERIKKLRDRTLHHYENMHKK